MQKAELFTGSGTLANEAVAAQISLLQEKGLILAAGEFGERLVKIARRWGLDCQVFQKEWGETFTPGEIAQFMDRENQDPEKRSRENQNYGWLWTVHCESSTGALIDLNGLKALCQRRGIKLCLDAVSSTGAVPVDLSHVYLASGTSGKAIGSFAGIAMVFYNHEIRPSDKIPMYLDLGYYHEKDGIPFTVSSNLIYALKKAVELAMEMESDNFQRIKDISAVLKMQFKSMGLNNIVPEEWSSPAIITYSLPKKINSEKFGEIMERKGYLLSYKSSYLIKRNWIQVCVMGVGALKTDCLDNFYNFYHFYQAVEKSLVEAVEAECKGNN